MRNASLVLRKVGLTTDIVAAGGSNAAAMSRFTDFTKPQRQQVRLIRKQWQSRARNHIDQLLSILSNRKIRGTHLWAVTFVPLCSLQIAERNCITLQVEAATDGVYRHFLRRVAEGRHLSLEAVCTIAKGRTWSGARPC